LDSNTDSDNNDSDVFDVMKIVVNNSEVAKEIDEELKLKRDNNDL